MELRRFQNKIEFLWARNLCHATKVLHNTSVTERTLKRFVTICTTLEAWSLKIACYFYTDISGDSNGNFGGKKRGISDCRVWRILKNCAHESHKVGTICAKPKHCKTRFVFPTKGRNTEILSGVFTDNFSGYWMYWLFMIFWLPGV